MLNLDTHILIHALADRLSPKERKALAENPWGISAIVLWELEKLRELGRIEVDLADFEVQQALRQITVFPITVEVCMSLRRLDFKSDPADELIAATSLAYGVKLVTRDEKIRRTKVVPLYDR